MSEQRQDLVDYSIIFEWDNALISELPIALKALKAVADQMREVNRPAEILITYDYEAIDGQQLATWVKECLDDSIPWEVIDTKGLRYYELKNTGVKHSRGRIIIFTDSDVLPEPGWLKGHLSAYERPDCHVVVGNSYVPLDNLYSKAMGLIWFLPLRAQDGPLTLTKSIKANNVSFRRDMALKYPFPTDSVRTRGQCSSLEKTLWGNAIPIFYQPAARSSHEAPNGFFHFMCKGLNAGRNYFLTKRMESGSWLVGLLETIVWWIKTFVGKNARVLRRHKQVNLPLWQVPFGILIGSAYWLLAFIGVVVTLINRDLIKKHFPI